MSRRRFSVLAALMSVVFAAGCPAQTPLEIANQPVPEGSATKKPGGSDTKLGGTAEGRVSNSFIFQLIDGKVLAPSALANGQPSIVGLTIDEAEAGRATYNLPYVLKQVTAPELPVENALVSVRGYDLKTIPELPSKYSLKGGSFYFANVPSRIAFFLEAQIETRERSYQLLGLTRTEDPGERTNVTIDMASSMVARELLRMWQLSGYRVSFKDLDPRDFNPLLIRLRKRLASGLPPGVTFDPSKVTMPSGDWSFAEDKKDSALLALDRISRSEDAISREIDRLYLAVNFTITRVRDTSRTVIPRPPSLDGPAPTTAPTSAPGTNSGQATPRPATLIDVTGVVANVSKVTRLFFKPDFTRDDDGVEGTFDTDATGKYTIKLSVGADDLAAFYEIFIVNADGSKTRVGGSRVFVAKKGDTQTLPTVTAPPAPS